MRLVISYAQTFACAGPAVLPGLRGLDRSDLSLLNSCWLDRSVKETEQTQAQTLEVIQVYLQAPSEIYTM